MTAGGHGHWGTGVNLTRVDAAAQRQVSVIAFQLVPGLGLTTPPEAMVVPFMSQIAVWPFVF